MRTTQNKAGVLNIRSGVVDADDPDRACNRKRCRSTTTSDLRLRAWQPYRRSCTASLSITRRRAARAGLCPPRRLEAPALYSALTWNVSTLGAGPLVGSDRADPCSSGAVTRQDMAGRVGRQRVAGPPPPQHPWARDGPRGDVLCRPGIGRGRGRLRAGDRLCVLRRGTVLSLRSSVPALEARLLDGASSFLAGHCDWTPTSAPRALANEDAFYRLCVCGCGSSAPARVML